MSDPARGYYAALTGILPQAEMLSYAVNHTFKIDRGVNLSLGLNYVVHPSPLFRLKDALISQLFLTLYF